MLAGPHGWDFASDGEQVQVRVADTPNPEGGWDNVPICGTAAIVNHEYAVIPPSSTLRCRTVLQKQPVLHDLGRYRCDI